ncbi:hypothetical protein [Agromyces atrinae]|uniref:Sortase n=1 Tax=Agromyces atrinae TaxID=592376 RepID=A0A4Q2M2C6_9MICO|nr:hypothetical protein [Agromyces atrinae]NYD68534.1 hypothetical protein [Agromyces atrinae]RXZ85919.1 hypothetical protein ESP50_11920 [Agromyces atrinae]
MKKKLAALFIAVAAFVAIPALGANAAGYAGQGPTVTASVGDTANLTFTGLPDGPSTATAPDAVTLSILKAGTASKPVVNGSVTYTAQASTPGTYTITVTAGGVTAVGSFTVVASDSANPGGGLAGTGFDVPVVVIWAAAGALLLGVALVVVTTFVRRNKAGA